MYDLDGLMQEKSETSDDLKKVMMSGKSMDAIHSPKSIKLKKGEHAFTILLSTKSIGTPSARTL